MLLLQDVARKERGRENIGHSPPLPPHSLFNSGMGPSALPVFISSYFGSNNGGGSGTTAQKSAEKSLRFAGLTRGRAERIFIGVVTSPFDGEMFHEPQTHSLGASTKYVHTILGFVDPLPLVPTFMLIMGKDHDL